MGAVAGAGQGDGRYGEQCLIAAYIGGLITGGEKGLADIAVFSDLGVLGGSTLGNIANTHASMNTVDIGLAQLAMHSSVETAGCADVDYMVRALHSLYTHNIVMQGDGEFVIE